MNSDQVIQTLIKERQTLQKIIERTTKYLRNAPEGYVRITKHKNGIQFYHKMDANKENGKYISVKDRKKAVLLIQKRYYKRLLETAIQQMDAIDSFLKRYDPGALQKVFLRESPIRQNLLFPAILPGSLPDAVLPDAIFAEVWQDFKYTGKPFSEDAPVHYTLKEERVRSKSEVLIANALYHSGIPYRYECPLTLEKGGTGKHVIHSDFTILRLSDRKTLYWEHLGMMDDAGYARSALQRIEDYAKNGFFPGEQLIITSETSRMPLNSSITERMIRHCILR